MFSKVGVLVHRFPCGGVAAFQMPYSSRIALFSKFYVIEIGDLD